MPAAGLAPHQNDGSRWRPAIFGRRVNGLYAAMRDALRRGDWAAFGRAFDALGVALGRRRGKEHAAVSRVESHAPSSANGGRSRSAETRSRRPARRSTIYDQFRHTRESLGPIVELALAGWSVCVVHGNGPQVGDELVRNEVARDEASPLPLGVLVAATAGWIGYMIQQSLENALARGRAVRGAWPRSSRRCRSTRRTRRSASRRNSSGGR